MSKGIRGYLELASGLGEMTLTKATQAANDLLALTGLDSTVPHRLGQVSALAEDLMAAATANRQNLVELIRREVDAAVQRLDVEKALAEVSRLAAAVDDMRNQLAGKAADLVPLLNSDDSSQGHAPSSQPDQAPAAPAPTPTEAARVISVTPVARQSLAKRRAAEKAAATKSPTTDSPPPPKTLAQKVAAKKTAAKKTAKKTTAKKSSSSAATKKTTTSPRVKKTVAKKTPAKKSASKKSTPTKGKSAT